MAAPKLSSEQKTKIVELIASRETFSTIARIIKCSRENVRYYAVKFQEEITKAREEYDAQSIDRGLRSREKRIEKLENLADRIEGLLQDVETKTDAGEIAIIRNGLMFKDVKVSPTGEKVEVEVFAGEAVRQYRGILDDIAKETGGRVNKTEISGDALKAYINIDMDKV